MAYCTLNSYKLKVNPLQIFDALKNERNLFFLDSSLNSNGSGRYSFLGIDPFFILKTKGENPFQDLRVLLDRYKLALPKNYPPFCAGAVGYLSYDLGFLLENKLKRSRDDDLKIPECRFGFYNTAIIIDNVK
ncbi:MAG TPA: aminodeoxychorismate synthase, component I, partial [Candidatus Omnitrophota bacterium]|nr:aminodeoxychorismate synthase, component I [Candidatus Omnitrophota bacterium]